jgi:outer membrane lipoprotein-sorting protein
MKEKKMLKNLMFAVLLMFVVSPAFANSCPAKVGKIDAALASGSAKNPEKVKTLRDKGEAQHKAGKHSDSLGTLIKAMKLAGIY